MNMITRNLREDVTHWTVTGSDGFGGFLYNTPVVLKGRWEDKAVLFRDTENEEVVSAAIVYLGVDISVGDYLAQGDQTSVSSPTSISGAHRVLQKHKTTDLRNLIALRKVFL